MDTARQEASLSGRKFGCTAKRKKRCESLNPMLRVDNFVLEYLIPKFQQWDGFLHRLVNQQIQRSKVPQYVVEGRLPLRSIEISTECMD